MPRLCWRRLRPGADRNSSRAILRLLAFPSVTSVIVLTSLYFVMHPSFALWLSLSMLMGLVVFFLHHLASIMNLYLFFFGRSQTNSKATIHGAFGQNRTICLRRSFDAGQTWQVCYQPMMKRKWRSVMWQGHPQANTRCPLFPLFLFSIAFSGCLSCPLLLSLALSCPLFYLFQRTCSTYSSERLLLWVISCSPALLTELPA